MPNDLGPLVRQSRAEDHDRLGDGITQLEGLGQIGHTINVRLFLQRGRHGRHAMAVAIGFDHGHERGLADARTRHPGVVPQRVPADLRPATMMDRAHGLMGRGAVMCGGRK